MSEARKAAIGLALLALVAGVAWRTMEPGKFRSLVWVLLAFFALRIVLALRRTR